MAIVKMKKLRLMAIRSNKDALLKELICKGCVEFSEIEGEVQDSDFKELLKRESSSLMTFKSQHMALVNAVGILDRYSPAKKPVLSALPEVGEDVLLDDSGVGAALAAADEISANEDRIKSIGAEVGRLENTIDALKPWASLDMPLGTTETQRCSVVLGTVAGSTDFSAMESALAAVTEEAELFLVDADKMQKYLVLVCMKEQHAAVMDCMRGFSFAAAPVSGMNGTARECIAAAEKELHKLADEKAGCAQHIVELTEHRDELKLAADVLGTKIARAEAEDKLYGLTNVLVMQGWMPAEREAELAEIFEKYDCAWETEDPSEDEYPTVPVQLKNNKFTNALNMVTNMYSLPAYGSVDANPLMAPFFILFYGLMMADIGYGLVMIAAALVAMAKIKPREGSLSFCQLLLYCGISTLAMGALTGGFFGDAPYQLVHMFNPSSTWEGLPYLFSPVNNSTMVLYGSMVLGLIHLNTGMVISFCMKVRRGRLVDGLWEEVPLWVILIGGIMAGLSLLGITDALATPGIVVMIIGAAALLIGSARGAKGFGIIGAAFGCIYNTLTGWFGDILSYSRIMALMLAGGVVAQVFNTIAAMPANGSGVNVFTVLAFIVIFLIGHCLNFGLNILGCYVHDLRLQCLEFFGKFYEDGGKPFSPLRIKSKYVRAK